MYVLLVAQAVVKGAHVRMKYCAHHRAREIVAIVNPSSSGIPSDPNELKFVEAKLVEHQDSGFRVINDYLSNHRRKNFDQYW